MFQVVVTVFNCILFVISQNDSPTLQSLTLQTFELIFVIYSSCQDVTPRLFVPTIESNDAEEWRLCLAICPLEVARPVAGCPWRIIPGLVSG